MAAKKPAKKLVKKAVKKAAPKASKKTEVKVTPKQEAFAEHYIANGGNGVQAARSAGYKGNVNTLNQVARQNLQIPTIFSRVRARLDGLRANSDEVLNLLADHLRADIADLADCFKETGELDLKKAQEIGVSRLVKKLRHRRMPVRNTEGEVVDYEYTTEIEIHDSQGAAAKLINVLGLKQKPGENERDVSNKREWANQKLKEVMEQLNLDEPQAREWINQRAPHVSEYLM